MKKIGFDWYQFGGFRESDKSGPISTGQGKLRGGNEIVVEGINGQKAETLDSHYYKGCGSREGKEREIAFMDYGVRRLTPTECERLQGFPDGWTETDCDGNIVSDTQRYKALGNSLALCSADYFMRGIKEVYEQENRKQTD